MCPAQPVTTTARPIMFDLKAAFNFLCNHYLLQYTMVGLLQSNWLVTNCRQVVPTMTAAPDRDPFSIECVFFATYLCTQSIILASISRRGDGQNARNEHSASRKAKKQSIRRTECVCDRRRVD